MPDRFAEGITANAIPALDTELLVTTTFPEVAPAGTLAKMIEELQLAVVAAVPLKVTVPDEPKPLPLIAMIAPTGPETGDKLDMLGVGAFEPTVKFNPLLGTPETVTTTFPVVAPVGTETTMTFGPQFA